MLSAASASRSSMDKLLGSLRHVSSCFPPARAFFQRLQVFASRCRPFQRRDLSHDVVEDLQWFRAVLQHQERFNGIPVSRFSGAVAARYHVFMDASDDGLCVLEPTFKQYLRVQFTEAEKGAFKGSGGERSNNVRELQSAVLAALYWGPAWATSDPSESVGECFHIDNSSAMAWASKRASRHPLAQLYNRLLSLAEF